MEQVLFNNRYGVGTTFIQCRVWFCATKTVTKTQCRVWFCALKTVTTAHLQHRDQLQWISHKFQCFYYVPHVYKVLLTLYPCHICFTVDCVQHPLRTQAMLLAKNSVMKSSQKSYRSTWHKWETFSSKYFPPLWTDRIRYFFRQTPHVRHILRARA